MLPKSAFRFKVQHFALPLVLLLATPIVASADSCDDLIASFEGALAAPDLSPTMKSQIEKLLGAGREAKARGDVASCEAARKMPMQSTPNAPGDGERKCEKTPNTV